VAAGGIMQLQSLNPSTSSVDASAELQAQVIRVCWAIVMCTKGGIKGVAVTAVWKVMKTPNSASKQSIIAAVELTSQPPHAPK
jgi:hypothetical protein